MIETLRGLGYTTATALADIIDNSISAGAENVNISFSFKGKASTISILDDGNGMSPKGLDRAMRLGEISPLEERAPNDLGRFGIGLKTASFSQCRRLTVMTKKQGESSCLRWDLDLLAASPGDGWFLLDGPAKGSEELLIPLGQREHGTLVLWEGLDKIVTSSYSEQNFLDLIDRVERHLAMVFHRYLEPHRSQFKININGRPIGPWNPFLTNHSATWSSPVVTFEMSGLEVQSHVLPHRDRLGQREYEDASGPDGWTAQQGFYVYRNRRLLVSGSWLGLGQGRPWTKEEAHRLVRIRLDIPNSADADWKIDIRKSVARPPVNVRERLLRLADDARVRARRVFAQRGKVRSGGAEPVIQAWRAEYFKGGMRYRIDENHPAVMAVLNEPAPAVAQVRAMLRIIEATIPVQRIWLDTAEAKDVPLTGFAGEPQAEVTEVLKVMYRNMVQKKGLTPEAARDQLLRTEPFHNYPYLVSALPNEVSIEEYDIDDVTGKSAKGR
jgi:hypothetical protein